jgi:hypothetical protein
MQSGQRADCVWGSMRVLVCKGRGCFLGNARQQPGSSQAAARQQPGSSQAAARQQPGSSQAAARQRLQQDMLWLSYALY